MITNGLIAKMRVAHSTTGGPVAYTFALNDEISMNELIGRNIRMEWSGVILCCSCGKRTKNSFGQGFCYNCFISSANASPCIISPELCRGHLGEGRDVEWEHTNHNQPHIVYLATSSGIKVGVTRATQMLTRWIDQGASYAIILAETPNRYLAGTIEVALKSQMSDKTNWQKMLKNEIDHSIDLVEQKGIIEDSLPFDLRDYISGDDTVYEIEYPVLQFPVKVKSLGFDKTPVIEGKLVGIKGQYLIFEDHYVINMRKHTSYEIAFSVVQ